MHEFAVARALIDAAADVARSENVDRVTRVQCRIGDLRQVDSWLLDEAFAAAREGTICSDAELCVERTHMEMDCDDCGKSFRVVDWNWACPDCGDIGHNARGGDELDLIEIDGVSNDEYRSLAECVREE